MARGLQHKGIVRRSKMLREGVRLFLENGYEKTTTASISRAAGMSPTSFFAAFESKEAMLLELVKIMFESQFVLAEQLHGETADPLLLYGIETALQMYIAELSEPVRELYVAAYSLPTTSEYIYRQTAQRLAQLFAEPCPQWTAQDFYETELASAGVTRAFMAKPADESLPMERKLSRYLHCCFTLYGVAPQRRQKIVDTVLQMPLRAQAEAIIALTAEKAKAGELLPDGRA